MNDLRRIVAPRWVAVLCGSLAVTLVAFSAGAKGSRDVLTTSIETALVEEGLVGATWALVAPEGTTIGAAGLNDTSRQLAMSPDDRVQVGSVAKTLVATGVLRLVTLGRIDLDASLARTPGGADRKSMGVRRAAAVCHLLDHTGGRRRADVAGVSLRADPDAPLRDGLTHPGGTPPAAPPGRAFSHSNTGYLLLGMLIRR
jgi:CubicO group peptidase (beta-lactamase class C family)